MSNRLSTRQRVRRGLLMIGVLLIVAIPAYVEFCFRRPIGHGPAGPAVELTAFQHAWSDQDFLLLGVGDSITRGLGASRTSHTFFNRLTRNPPDEWDNMQGRCLANVLPNLSTLNLAVSGSTSIDHAEIIAQKLDRQPADRFGIVVMTTGGNDLIHAYGRRPPVEGAMYGATVRQAAPWIDRFEVRLRANLARIIESFPGGCEIFLGDIYDPTDGVGDAPSIFLPPWPNGLRIHQQYNERIVEVAGTFPQVHLVKLHETFLGHGSHCRQFWRAHYDVNDPHYWFYSNIEDPNDRGYDAIRRIFLNKIVEQRKRIIDHAGRNVNSNTGSITTINSNGKKHADMIIRRNAPE